MPVELIRLLCCSNSNRIGLLRELLDRCAIAGIREVIAVIVDNGNTASEKLHLRCGFTEVGRLRGVGTKHGSTLDTVLMQRHLPSAVC